MNHILKKIKRFIQFNGIVKVKIFSVCLLLVAMAVQGRLLDSKELELKKIRKEKELIVQVPEMEKKLKTINLKLLKPESQINAIQNILEGTSLRNNVYHAVIDGEVYSTGDTIGDYTIIKISLKTITLENKPRDEIKELSFPEYPYPEPNP